MEIQAHKESNQEKWLGKPLLFVKESPHEIVTVVANDDRIFGSFDPLFYTATADKTRIICFSNFSLQASRG